MSLQSKQVEVFDPFSTFDPDAKPFAPSPSSKQFNPNVDPFDPNSSKARADLSTWQVVAAEYSGKAVAVMLSSDSVLQVCTSPSFNSKCSHKGLSCLDWDTVDLGKGRSATPEPTFKSLHDSGVENFTDNSSDEIEKINRVAKWSAEASRHAEEWSADVSGNNAEWSDGYVGNQQWSEGVAGVPHDWSGAWSGGVHNTWATPHTEEYHPDGYHITVEYHPEEYHPAPEDAGYHHAYPAEEEYHLPEETGFTKPCYGNDPVVVFQPWESQVLPTGQESWSDGLAGLSLGGERTVEAVDKERIREEFKRKILSNVTGGGEGELDEEAKIREDFKNQILSNLTLTEDETSEDKIKEAFRRQVLSNLKDAASNTATNDNNSCDDEVGAREAFKKQILANLKNPL